MPVSSVGTCLPSERDRFGALSPWTEVVVSDTIPVTQEKRNGKITVLSVAPLLGEAIYRIHKGISVGEMFDS